MNSTGTFNIPYHEQITRKTNHWISLLTDYDDFKSKIDEWRTILRDLPDEMWSLTATSTLYVKDVTSYDYM